MGKKIVNCIQSSGPAHGVGDIDHRLGLHFQNIDNIILGG